MNNVFEYFLNETEQARYVMYSSTISVLKIYPTKYEKELVEEFLLWPNRIGGVLGALGRRFDPWSSTVS